jgi:hypothetical protein
MGGLGGMKKKGSKEKVPGSFSLIKKMNLEPSSSKTFLCCWFDEANQPACYSDHASERRTAGQKPRRFVAQRNNISAWSGY